MGADTIKIDANAIAVAGYAMLQKQGVIPNKPKHKLTFDEIAECSNRLQANLQMNNNVFNTTDNPADKRRSIFMVVLFANVIAYLNGVDMNDFISLTPRKNVK